jgi:hypothetical protein
MDESPKKQKAVVLSLRADLPAGFGRKSFLSEGQRAEIRTWLRQAAWLEWVGLVFGGRIRQGAQLGRSAFEASVNE